jgi:hypothetical protein
MSATAEIEFQDDMAVVEFGRDEAGRPRASAFGQSEADLATKAAGLMGMQLLRIDSDEQRMLAAKLPRGRVFASGRAFVSFVKVGLFDALTALAGASAASPAPKAEPTSAAPPRPPEGTSKADLTPETWDDISVGNIVLATEGPQEGWFESIVLRVEDDVLMLRWRDWPRLPTFTRRPWQLSLLPPGRRA